MHCYYKRSESFLKTLQEPVIPEHFHEHLMVLFRQVNTAHMKLNELNSACRKSPLNSKFVLHKLLDLLDAQEYSTFSMWTCARKRQMYNDRWKDICVINEWPY
jgi:hypothetical protein